ncbi:hypothetical protein CBOM_00617 [Ceraceosorus bombacis]|uniref:Uncharacterized protein n=1 Tax=Ceraceosorus bombacis TaxID=401625 RepID=A0A0P1B9I5_9BASI|nr:hypothetical protein CBOM_00617 [Ceraceosorus bombacis]
MPSARHQSASIATRFMAMLWVLAAVLATLQGGRTFQLPPPPAPVVNFNDQAADQIYNQYRADLDTFRSALHDWWRTQSNQDPNIARIDVHRMIRRRDGSVVLHGMAYNTNGEAHASPQRFVVWPFGT